MSDPMLDILIGMPLLAFVFCMAGVCLWSRLRGVLAVEKAEEQAAVSVIIPARNEAHNLPKLLSSLISQRNGPMEIIVVDDHSTDGTAEVAREFGAEVVTPGALPEGWRGKPWACHQGALAACGEVFCFLDADTWFTGEDSWRHLVGAAGKGAFSVCPWHEVRRPYECLSLFFNLNMVLGTVPHGLFGQVLWIHRDDYTESGGHERVAGRVLENHALAEHCREIGIPVRSATGLGIVSFRMYPDGVGGLVEGWSKGFAAGAVGTPGRVMTLIVIWLTGLMVAFVSLAMAPDSLWAWVVYALASAQVGVYARKVGSFPWWTAPLYPVLLVFFFGLFARAKKVSGKTVTWKGRDILAD